tara:strand:- start:44 stop:259 length:216 start_codon:yes stop_codon:yes gene_type:complete
MSGELFIVEKLSNEEEQEWLQLKQKMTNGLKQNLHEILSKMKLDDRILFVRYFMKNYKQKLDEVNNVSINE